METKNSRLLLSFQKRRDRHTTGTPTSKKYAKIEKRDATRQKNWTRLTNLKNEIKNRKLLLQPIGEDGIQGK